ncbi:MAG: hypothetical protein Q4C11_00035 [Clostridium sp.]|nr:hypothetical protein [Clostridium sp.]
MNKENLERKMKELQIGDFAQFIDVLEVIEKYENIEDVKLDIKFRKKYLKESIELMEKSLLENENK